MAKCEPKRKEEEALLKFLQMTEDGEYAPVEKSADVYTRIEAEDRQVGHVYAALDLAPGDALEEAHRGVPSGFPEAVGQERLNAEDHAMQPDLLL